MNGDVVRRFTYLAGTLLIVAMLGALVFGDFFGAAPGDYYVQKGDQRLSEGQFDKALKNFDLALEEMPNHRGALMGRALVFIQREDYDTALEELSYLIDFLDRTLPEDTKEDPTGYGVLAAAYANRGIIHDRLGNHRKALDAYIQALRTDEEAIDGPSIFDEVLYGYRAATVRGRAEYLAREFKKPPEQRLLRLPEKDADQRMYKP
jgi:tetratricopeptide (TPR) repeat protein